MKFVFATILALASVSAFATHNLNGLVRKIDIATKNIRVAEARLEYLQTHNLSPQSLQDEILETREYTAWANELLDRTNLSELDDESAQNRMKHLKKVKRALRLRAGVVNSSLAKLIAQ